jgi:hypothetical protein
MFDVLIDVLVSEDRAFHLGAPRRSVIQDRHPTRDSSSDGALVVIAERVFDVQEPPLDAGAKDSAVPLDPPRNDERRDLRKRRSRRVRRLGSAHLRPAALRQANTIAATAARAARP